MKYFVLESAIVDGSQANALTVKDDFNEARMLFHQIRAAALANLNVTYAISMIIDDEGRVYESEYHGTTQIDEDIQQEG